MLFDDFKSQVWAIHPTKLEEISSFLEKRFSDVELHAQLAKLPDAATPGKSGNKASDNYRVENGIAIIPVYGTLIKRANLFTEYSGGTSYQILRRDIEAAVKDPRVDGILLDIDSPGGTTDGIVETSDLVFNLRSSKPIVAFAEGLVASAAQWIASSAHETVIGETTHAGSIGVAMVHYERSEMDKQMGLKRTEIVAGKYKRMGSDAAPLTDEAKTYLQGQVDYMYEIFLGAVARNKGISVEDVLAMADGKIFTGRQAVEVGLVDHVGTMAQAKAILRKRIEANYTQRGKGMKAQEIKEQLPDAYQEIFDVGKASVNVDTIRAEAASQAAAEAIVAERARCTQISVKGADYPEVAQKAIEEGTTIEAAGWLFLEAEKTRRGDHMKQFGEAPPSAGHGAKPKDNDADGDYMAAVDRYQKDNQCSRTQALLAVAKKEPALHQAWLNAKSGKGE